MPTLDHLRQLLPDHFLRVVDRRSDIPAMAGEAAVRAGEHPGFVRGDIGQILGVFPEEEVRYGTPVGLPSLRAVLAELWTRTYDLAGVGGLGPEGLRAEHVAITTGAAQGLSLLFACLATGEVVGLPRGHWENYTNGVELARGTPVLVDFFDDAGRLDIPGLRRAVTEHGIHLLLLNFPCNPTGAVLDEGEVVALAALARELDILMLADEVYGRLRFDGQAPVSMLRHAPERTVVLGSASKEYLLPGARVGFVVSTSSLLTDHVLRKLIRAHTASPNVLGQRRVQRLIEDELVALREGRAPRRIAHIRSVLAERQRALLAVLEAHGMSAVGRPAHRPEGTIFLMARLPRWWDGDDQGFARHTLEANRFSVVPGRAFGMPGCVRFAFGSMTLESIARLDRHLSELAAR